MRRGDSSRYEKRASVRLLLKFLSLDIVPFMVMKYPGDFMGNGRVLLSGGLAPSKEFGVILWDGRSPFLLLLLLLLLLLFCIVFQTPPYE